jgi:alkylated DNA repair dioxygenase AlkB
MFKLEDHLWRDIFSAEDEIQLDRAIPDLTRKYSRQILRYGVSKYQNNLVSVEVPQYLLDLASRLTQLGMLKFVPQDYTINIYKPGDSIGYHIDLGDDDTVILNLLCPVTFNLKKGAELVSFEFPQRSVFLLTGEWRNLWEHSIEPVKDRRLSIVFR